MVLRSYWEAQIRKHPSMCNTAKARCQTQRCACVCLNAFEFDLRRTSKLSFWNCKHWKHYFQCHLIHIFPKTERSHQSPRSSSVHFPWRKLNFKKQPGFAKLLLGFALLLVTYLTTQLSLHMRDLVLFPRDKQGDGGGFCVHGWTLFKQLRKLLVFPKSYFFKYPMFLIVRYLV